MDLQKALAVALIVYYPLFSVQNLVELNIVSELVLAVTLIVHNRFGSKSLIIMV